MVRKRELVKQRGAFDSMSLAECVEVRAQGFGVAGNIDNVVKLGNQLQRFIIDAGAGRIDKNGGKTIIFQRNALLLQAAEFAALSIGFGKLFGGETGDFDVVPLVSLDVPLRGVNGSFGHFGRQNLTEMLRERQGEIAVAAVKFEQIAAEILCDITRPSEHFFAHAGIGLGKAALDLAVAEGFAVYVQLFGYIVLSQNDFLPPTPTDDMDAQFTRQGFSGTLPRFAQFFVVNHGNQHFAA